MNDSATADLCCPYCRNPLRALLCSTCEKRFAIENGILPLVKEVQGINRKTIDAYKLYSQFYAVIALLTYWMVWRGNLSRHIRFFSDALFHDDVVLDLATGDGSLTKISLFSRSKKRAKQVVAVDISEAMLVRAKAKLRKDTVFLKADVENLPLPDDNFKLVTCFGGFNSFPSGENAMREIERVLRPKGHVRGSFLLMPQRPWRQALVRKWIAQGYQTCEMTMELFDTWIAATKLKKTQIERHGDVILFELQKSAADPI